MGDVYVKTLKSDGIQGLYRGFTISAVGIFIYRGMYFGLFDTLKPMLIGGKDSSVAASFLLGWAVTVTAGLMSYPIDTIRRRMMMTSGGGVKYKGSIDCAVQIMKNEGFMSMMKGAGANVLRGVAGAGVLAGFDKFQAMYIVENQPLRQLLFVGSMVFTSNRGPSVKERDPNVYGDHHCGLLKQKLCRTSSTLVDLLMIVRL